jgi:Na+-translocating ferredoxin:NAD+ oxidoreductase RNF subunit RnfB
MYGALVTPMFVLGFTGLFLGVGLGIASKKFAVEHDPRIEQIFEYLPKANCGVCGFPGCFNYAKAIVENGAKPDACRIGGATVAGRIGEALGLAINADQTAVKLLARIYCNGSTSPKSQKGIYEGAETCRSAALVLGGTVKCSYGCLGFGDCIVTCPFGAITPREDQPPLIDPEKCTSCGLCVKACPKKLIKLTPRDQQFYVACSSQAKGKAVKEVCSVGCIACGLCSKKCSTPEAVKLEQNLSRIDQQHCLNCGDCYKACPTGSIQWMN